MSEGRTRDETLSADDRAAYGRDGYLLVRRLFDADEMAPWIERFLAIVNGRVEPAEEMLVMRDVMVAKGAVEATSREEAVAKVQDFHDDAVLFDGYARNAKLLDLAAALIGEDIKSIHTMLINKPPNVDGRHPFHQDLAYFPFRPADMIIATWTALEPCTRENGCLQVVPGTHTGELMPHGNPDWEYLNFGYFAAEGVGAHPGRRHLEMEPGDTLLFHPLLLHGSGVNRSSGFRRAISAHYANTQCKYLGEGIARGGRPHILVRGREYEGGL